MDEGHVQRQWWCGVLADGASLMARRYCDEKMQGCFAGMKGQEGTWWEVRLSRWVRVTGDQVKTGPYIKSLDCFLQAGVATESV